MRVCVRITPRKSGGYMASCPTLPGCVACGETKEEAAQKLMDSVRGYVAAISDFVPDRVEYEVVQT